MLNRLKKYLQESYREIHRVNWPTRHKTVNLTLVVIGISLGVAVFLGLLDLLFTFLLESFLL
jgi:preprotein translocase subunit SecE